MIAENYIIEIATNDYTSAKAAVAGGADRIELCMALSEGGLTPSMALIQKCRNDFDVAVFPIIRPRSGDFLYNEDEFEIMKQDALFCKRSGCDGVVVGFLNSDGAVNKAWTSKIVELVYPLEVTFHRAFDRCRDPLEAMETIIEAGCQRILTSGLKSTAPEGIDMVIMMLFSGAISRFINQHPSLQVLALAFLIMIGVMLVAEGFHQEINKSYIYVAIAFSLVVELINMRLRRARESITLNDKSL